jgi:hypothetical protein
MGLGVSLKLRDAGAPSGPRCRGNNTGTATVALQVAACFACRVR